MLDFFSGFGALEHYLSYQSGKGLHLKRLNHFLITFRRGEPKNVRYRVDVWRVPPSAEWCEQEHARGWDLAAQWQDYYIFASYSGSEEYGRAPENLGAELAGKVEQAWRESGMWLVGTLFCLLFAVLIVLDYFTGDPVVEMLGSTAYSIFLFSVYFLVTLVVYFYRYRRIKRLQKQLLDGIPIDHEAPWKPAWWKNILVQGAAVLLLMLWAALLILQFLR
ncbi:MAG: DUF2812 domain-containing protein [Clostridiales bacterium]|nr:DUF2812 domain-containing protein [Clostridiales bacterium]